MMDLICTIPAYCSDGAVTPIFWLSVLPIILGTMIAASITGASSESPGEALLFSLLVGFAAFMIGVLVWLLLSYAVLLVVRYPAFRIFALFLAGTALLGFGSFIAQQVYEHKKYHKQSR